VVLGLKINLSKSEIIPIGAVDDIESLASLFVKYLGLPLGGALQVDYYMEWYCREYGEEVGGLEEALFIVGWEVDVD
jgi:hypothetical protein